MKNLNFYTEDSFEFHKGAIAGKKMMKADGEIQSRLRALNNDIEGLFKEYKMSFDTNELEKLAAHGYVDAQKSDLLSLYNYRSKVIQNFKAGITTTATNRIINTCQNCTIGEVSSFDHVLPKEEFAEYAVNPLNLFPSCTVCNSAKGKYWLENGERLFLNLYLDSLPKLQYLFVNISFTDGAFTTKFYVDNPNGIETHLFKLIYTHYTRLKLPKRFSDCNDAVIPTLQNKMKPFVGKLPMEQIIATTAEQSNLNRELYGFNYWQSILELELLKNVDFLATLA